MRTLTLALLLALVPAAARAGEKDDGFVPMFNGKDLAGWVNVNCAPETFFVKDDMVITTGRPTGFLRTARQYENFILELDWMHVPPNPKAAGNSGVFVWADPIPAVGSPYTRGIEVQVLVNFETDWATSHGDIFSIWGAKCKPDRPHPTQKIERCLPSERRAKGANEWNHYRIEAKDGAIKLHVNGKEVSGVSECNPRKGYLALESEGSECHFRNLKIKELPTSDPKAEEVADEARGFMTLFTGLDLKGWDAGDQKDNWKVGDNVLKYDGKARDGVLKTEKEYGDFEMTLDVKPAKDAKAGLQFGGNDSSVLYGGDAGKYARWVLTNKAGKWVMKVNGKQITSGERKAGTGPIVLKADGAVDFMNLFVREPK